MFINYEYFSNSFKNEQINLRLSLIRAYFDLDIFSDISLLFTMRGWI